MNAVTNRAALLFALLAAMAAPARAVSYQATLLHPTAMLWSHAFGVAGATQVGTGAIPTIGGYYDHALLWTGTAESVVDLNPPDYRHSYATGASGSSQVGYGFSAANLARDHALLWHGTAESVVDLHPSGFDETFATAVSGESQVGFGYVYYEPGNPFSGSVINAILWKGTAASAVNLHPASMEATQAFAVSGDVQVGEGISPVTETGNYRHALMWHDTAQSVIDLHPAGYNGSSARGASEGSQVGWADTGGFFDFSYHAILWHGTAESAVVLNPAGFSNSVAQAAFGDTQVGHGYGPTTGDKNHALAWKGSAASAHDLQPYVSALNPAFVSSIATGIAANGSIVGYAWAADNLSANAVLWTPVPEPAGVTLLVCGLAFARAARGRRGRLP